MSKKVLGFVVVCLSLFSVVAVAGVPGVPESPVSVSVQQAHAPVFQPSPVYGVQQNCPPAVSNGVAYAPYEVRVQYTPIQPQPGECTYCTVLPYGCPDGAPISNQGMGCGSCGIGSCGLGGCGLDFSGVGNGATNLVGGLLGYTLNTSCCLVKTVLGGSLGLVGNTLSCFMCPNANANSFIQ